MPTINNKCNSIFGKDSGSTHQFTGSVLIERNRMVSMDGNFPLEVLDNQWSWWGASRIFNIVNDHDNSYKEPYGLYTGQHLLITSSVILPNSAPLGAYVASTYSQTGSLETSSASIIGLKVYTALGNYNYPIATDASILNIVGVNSRISRDYIYTGLNGDGRIISASAFNADLYVNSMPNRMDNYIAYRSDLLGKNSIALNKYHILFTGDVPSYFGGNIIASSSNTHILIGSTKLGTSVADNHQIIGNISATGSLIVTGSTSVLGSVTASNLIVNNTIIASTITASGDLVVSGGAYFNSASISGSLFINGNLIVSGHDILINPIVSGSLTVHGTITSSGDFNIAVLTGSYTASSDYDIYLISGSGNINLYLYDTNMFPSSSIKIKLLNNLNLTIYPSGNQLIEFDTTSTLDSKGQAIELIPFNENWYVT